MKTRYLSMILFVMLVVLVPQVANAQMGRVFFGSQHPQIAVSRNTVDVLWNYFNPNDDTYLITSNDNGTSLGEKIKLNRNDTWGIGFGNPIFDGNNIYRIVTNSSTGTQISFMKSADYGHTYTKPVVIAGTPNTLQQVEVDKFLMTGNYIYVVWSLNHFVGNQNVGTLFLSTSVDKGLTFDKPVQLSRNDTAWSGLDAVTSQNKTYFVWQSQVQNQCIPNNCSIQVHLRSIKNNTLDETSTPFVLDNIQQLKISTYDNNVYLTGVAIKTDSTNHVVNEPGTYYGNVTTHQQWVFFSKSEDGGVSFDGITNLSGSANHCMTQDNGGRCEIGWITPYASSTNVYVVWTAENYTKNANEAFFVGRTDGGNIFGKVIKLDPYGFEGIVCQDIFDECISIGAPQTPNTVYLTWTANKVKTYGSYLIFAKSTDGGNTFDYADMSNVTQINSQPVLSLGPGIVYLAGVKSGFPDGNHAFFSKSVDGGRTFSTGIDLDLQKEASIPEFPFAVPVLLISIVSVIAFYKMRFKK